MSDEPRNAAARKGSLLQTIQAVGWSFFGIRRSSDNAVDVSKLNPVHLIIVGVLAAALFVASLMLLVNWVVSSGMAQ
jgi:hypothetical protein